jgi:putative DNA primase/helicase
VYDHGQFLFSHHATDPCSGKLVNSFDLVRLHKFHELDDDAKPGTFTKDLPSFKAMCELATSDTYVAALLSQERYEKATEDFQQPADAEDNLNWMTTKLEINKTTGQPLKTLNNIIVILENDPLLKNKMVLDEFANRVFALGALPWDKRKEKRIWGDADDAGFAVYIEKIYEIQMSESRLQTAMLAYASKHRINDVKEYLTALNWDGVKRLDTLLIDYLGAEDNEYTRAVMRKSLTAAVARIMTPGVKYDYMPILVGPQDIGKSTFLQILGKDWFSDNLQTFEGKEAAEMLRGVWINEIGELNGFNRFEVNAIKQFLSRTDDIYRKAFGRRTDKYPRQCVFFGTTNDDEFLRDTTGNRRFWPVQVWVNKPTKSIFTELRDELDQIWAEAYMRWVLGEKLYLVGDVKAIAVEEQKRRMIKDPLQGLIEEFLKRPVPEDWQKWNLERRNMFWSGMINDESQLAPRDRICAMEIWRECLKEYKVAMPNQDARRINAILEQIPGWERATTIRCGPDYGIQKGFKRSIYCVNQPSGDVNQNENCKPTGENVNHYHNMEVNQVNQKTDTVYIDGLRRKY